MTNYFPLHVPMQVTPITVSLPQYQHPRYLHGREELSLLSFVYASEGHTDTVSLPSYQHPSYYGYDELLSFACGLLEGHLGKASTASRWYQHPS